LSVICSACTQNVIHSRTSVVSTAGMSKAVPQIRLRDAEMREYVHSPVYFFIRMLNQLTFVTCQCLIHVKVCTVAALAAY